MKIGIDVGGSHVGIGLVNEKYEIVDKIDYVWKQEEKENLYCTIEKYVIKLISEICEKNDINIETIDTIGIGFPNKHIKDGIVNAGDDNEFDLISRIQARYKIPIYLKNDVKCSGMCEKTIGSLKQYENVLFLTLGTGIGGAYFYKDQLVVPNTYQGFEIGHMMIKADGRKCRCGQNGCFEEYSSMRAFRNKIKEIYNLDDINSKIVLDIYDSKEKEDEMNKAIDEYIKYLSIGLSNLIHIFEPDAIGIGGSFVHYERIFMEKLKIEVKKNFPNREIPEILLAQYANDAGIIGASMLTSN